MYQRLTLVLQLGPNGELSEDRVRSAVRVVVRYADIYITPQRMAELLWDHVEQTIIPTLDVMGDQLRLPLPLQKGAYLNEATVGEALGFIVDSAPNLTAGVLSEILSAAIEARRTRYFASKGVSV